MSPILIFSGIFTIKSTVITLQSWNPASLRIALHDIFVILFSEMSPPLAEILSYINSHLLLLKIPRARSDVI